MPTIIYLSRPLQVRDVGCQGLEAALRAEVHEPQLGWAGLRKESFHASPSAALHLRAALGTNLGGSGAKAGGAHGVLRTREPITHHRANCKPRGSGLMQNLKGKRKRRGVAGMGTLPQGAASPPGTPPPSWWGENWDNPGPLPITHSVVLHLNTLVGHLDLAPLNSFLLSFLCF